MKNLPAHVEQAMVEMYDQYCEYPEYAMPKGVSNSTKCTIIFNNHTLFCMLPNFVWNYFNPEFPEKEYVAQPAKAIELDTTEEVEVSDFVLEHVYSAFCDLMDIEFAESGADREYGFEPSDVTERYTFNEQLEYIIKHGGRL